MAELDNKQIFDKVVFSLERQLGVKGLVQVDNGLEFCILRGELNSRPVAIKVPRDRVFSNVNDAHIESRTLLDQEFALMKHVKAHGIKQVPDPISDTEVEGFGALVMSYIPSDDTKPDQFKLGQLLAKIHTIQPPTIELSAQEGMEIPDLIDQRLHQRWGELSKLTPDLPKLPELGIIRDALGDIEDVKQLLHMDFREANLRTHKGQILAVVDWSNALIGHPALELARAAETGETGEEFLKGYASMSKLPVVSRLVETIFRLDTATMLALVFLSEAPDPERATILVRRVRMLFKDFQEELSH